MNFFGRNNNADVVKLADTHGLEPCAFGRVGSTPSIGTKTNPSLDKKTASCYKEQSV